MLKQIEKIKRQRAVELGGGLEEMQVEGEDVTEKKTFLFGEEKGWDKAFEVLGELNGHGEVGGLVKVKEIQRNGGVEAVGFESFVAGAVGGARRAENGKGKMNESRIAKEERVSLEALQKKGLEAWKLSEPIGGRMISVDPVFTNKEKYVSQSSSCP